MLPLLAKLFEFVGHYASYRAEHLRSLAAHRSALEQIAAVHPELKRASAFLEVLCVRVWYACAYVCTCVRGCICMCVIVWHECVHVYMRVLCAHWRRVGVRWARA